MEENGFVRELWAELDLLKEKRALARLCQQSNARGDACSWESVCGMYVLLPIIYS